MHILIKVIYIKLYITFFLSFYILSNVRKALFYRLYGHFYFLFTFAYRGISSYVFPLKRGKFRGKYFYAIRRFISVLALSIEECAYQSIVILILEWPMIYCKSLGFMFLCAIFVQNVCLNICGVICGSGFSLWCLLYFFTIRTNKLL